MAPSELSLVSMTEYIRDSFNGPPSLSSSVAYRLLTRSPLHAFTIHARLNPAWRPDDDRAFDLGTAAHAVLLEGRALSVIKAPDYRTKAAQAARDAAKEAGGLPVLVHQAEAITRMVALAREAIRDCPDLNDLGELLPERTMRWQDGEAWCRARPDWITADHAVVLSYKTTGACAEPDAFTRGPLLGNGYDLQAAFETRGVEVLTGSVPRYVWIVQETEEPYAVSLLGLSPALADLAVAKYRIALAQWSYCIAASRWPSYSERICWVEPPQWESTRWAEREYRDRPLTVIDDGRPIEEQLLEGR